MRMSREPHGLSPWTTELTRGYTDVPFIVPEPGQARAVRAGDGRHHSFMFLSEDAASCSLVSFGTVDPSLRFVSLARAALFFFLTPSDSGLTDLASETPYCNETQMTACADAADSQWYQHHDSVFALDQAAFQVVTAPMVDVRAVDGSVEGMGAGHIAAAAPAARSTKFQEPAALGQTDEAGTVSPPERPQTTACTWSAGNAASLYADTIRQVKLAVYGPNKAQITVDVVRTTESTPDADATIQSKRPSGVSKPSGTGNKQLVGMGVGLATVLIIFVVWM